MPGALVHDRLARLREPVDERGLADVRIADDGDLPHVCDLLRLDRERDDLVDDLVEREAGGVDRDRVGRRRRAASARGVRSRSSRSACSRSTTSRVGAELGGAAARALLRRRR